MFIETETTPNPATLKFLPGQPVMQAGTREFTSPEDAEAIPVGPASYFGVGGVYGTASKLNRHGPIGPDGFGAIRAILRRRAPDLPAVGIAGITADNAGAVIAAGADGVAIISDLFMADDVKAAARRLAAAVVAARKVRE